MHTVSVSLYWCFSPFSSASCEKGEAFVEIGLPREHVYSSWLILIGLLLMAKIAD